MQLSRRIHAYFGHLPGDEIPCRSPGRRRNVDVLHTQVGSPWPQPEFLQGGRQDHDLREISVFVDDVGHTLSEISGFLLSRLVTGCR